MDDRLFVDTWGWCSFADRGEPFHDSVRTILDDRWRDARNVTTSDYVLDETITLVFRRISHHAATKMVDALESSIAEGFVQLETISTARFWDAKSLRLKFRDRPDISFTDFTSFVVMRELGIREVLTADAHFGDGGFVPVPRPAQRRRAKPAIGRRR